MPEAAALLFVAGITALLFVVLRLTTRKPGGAEERQRLCERISWLEDRQRHAAEKNWDEEMKTRIAQQLAHARRELEAMGGNG